MAIQQAPLGARERPVQGDFPLDRVIERASDQAVPQAATQQEIQISDGDIGNSAAISVQTWLERIPLRPTAGWAGLAALLALGLPSTGSNVNWQTVALLLILIDPLWGSIWRLAFGRQKVLPLRKSAMNKRIWLPYLQSGSPAAQLLGLSQRSADSVSPLLLRVVLPTFLVAGAVAAVIGPMAIWMTALVILCAILGWVSRHSWHHQPHLLRAIVTVALPWALVLSQLSSHQIALTNPTQWRYQFVLIALWTLHVWGEGLCLNRLDPKTPLNRLGIALLAVADVGLGILLILAKVPLVLVFLAIVWLPTWISIYQNRPLPPLRFWWLVAMLISAIGLGQSLI